MIKKYTCYKLIDDLAHLYVVIPPLFVTVTTFNTLGQVIILDTMEEIIMKIEHDRNRERSLNEYTPSDRNMNRSMDRPSNRNFDRYILEDRYTPGTRDQMHLIERDQVYQRHLKQPRHTIGRF